MRRLLRPLPLLAFVLASGCIFQNVGSEEKLRDAVVGYNDETRWNRMDLAQLRVTPARRGDFRLRHHRWGRDIQIADMDILDVQVSGEEQENATSVVHISWYDQSTMMIADTIVAQEWERVTGGYILVEETVREGNGTLLEIPPHLLPTESTDEAAPSDGEAATDASEAEASRETASATGLGA
jgi:hypothetical protein